MKRKASCVAVSVILAASNTAAQTSPPIETLQRPALTYGQAFTNIVGIRELADGRLIVLDSHERTIVLFDASGDPLRVIGRTGSGPGEYLMPSAILAVAGDSTLIFDGPNNRFLVITSDGEAGDVLDPQGRPPGNRQPPLGPRPARAADLRGHFYAEAPAVEKTGTQSTLIDSAAIERWSANSVARDTIAYVPKHHVPGTIVVGEFVSYRASDAPAYRSTPQWAVSGDGWLAIVNESPYRVDFIAPAAHRTVGQEIAYTPIPVTDAMKDKWCDGKDRPSPTLVGRRGGGPPSIVMSKWPCTPPKEWPEVLPPFRPGAATFAGDGTVWVRRALASDEPTRFDVIDRSGRLVRRFEFSQQAVGASALVANPFTWSTGTKWTSNTSIDMISALAAGEAWEPALGPMRWVVP